MVLRLSKKVHFFWNFFVLEKCKSIKSIRIHASEISCDTLSENGLAYYAMTYCFGDVRVLSQGILLNYCWVSIYILIANILLTVNVNFFNILRFLAKVSSKLQKNALFLKI